MPGFMAIFGGIKVLRFAVVILTMRNSTLCRPQLIESFVLFSTIPIALVSDELAYHDKYPSIGKTRSMWSLIKRKGIVFLQPIEENGRNVVLSRPTCTRQGFRDSTQPAACQAP